MLKFEIFVDGGYELPCFLSASTFLFPTKQREKKKVEVKKREKECA